MTTDTRLAEMWEGCLKNDRKQQELLYRTLAPRMLAVCMRYAHDRDEAQDILQEGFIKMFKNDYPFFWPANLYLSLRTWLIKLKP